MDSKFNPSAGGHISLADARKMVNAFRDKNPGHIHAYYFGAEHYKKLLELPGCVGIRTYHGIDDGGNHVHILVPTDMNGQSIFPANETMSTNSNIVEQGQPCPPFCDTLWV